MEKIKNIFPLRVSEYSHNYGMGVIDWRYALMTTDGNKICDSDYEPKYINAINRCIEDLLRKSK